MVNEDRAFSSLVADNQYSVLGLMLLGTLARVKSVLGRLVEDEDENEVEMRGDDVAVEAAEVVVEQDEKQSHDFGEVVRREEILAAVKEEVGAVTEKKSRPKKRLAIDKDEMSSKAGSTPSKAPKKKRKKGKGDAFDDLFASLL